MTVVRLCELAGVSRSGFYSYLKTLNTHDIREDNDKRDFQLIVSAYKYKGRNKGVRQIKMTLARVFNVIMNHKKISRLMKKYGLICPIRRANPYRRMAKALKTNNYAENILQRNFKREKPGEVILSDITYIFYGNGKVAYLSTAKDPLTKQIPAYKLSESLQLPFVLDTVHMLKQNESYVLQPNAIFHTDQGCHYTSNEFRKLLASEGFVQSMSRRGNCWDNAPQESFFGHMKDELNLAGIKNFEELSEEIDKYLSYYNNDRYQWELAMMSPNEYAEYLISNQLPYNDNTRAAIMQTQVFKSMLSK